MTLNSGEKIRQEQQAGEEWGLSKGIGCRSWLRPLTIYQVHSLDIFLLLFFDLAHIWERLEEASQSGLSSLRLVVSFLSFSVYLLHPAHNVILEITAKGLTQEEGPAVCIM